MLNRKIALKRMIARWIRPKNAHKGDVIVLGRYRAVYFAIPKVANSSFAALAVDLLQDEIEPKYLDPEWNTRPFRTAEGRKYLRKAGILVRSLNRQQVEYWKFAFVRHPLDRLVSCYAEKVAQKDAGGNRLTGKYHVNGVSRSFRARYGSMFFPGMSFKEFVATVSRIPEDEADKHFVSQHTFLEDRNGAMIPNFIGKLETLSEDMRYVARKCGFPKNTQLPHLLQSKRVGFESYYDSATAAQARKRYSKDCEIFGY